MENFKVKNRLVYGGYIALLWVLGDWHSIIY